MKERTVFLKLGGSLITDKHTPRQALEVVLSRLAAEIAFACQSNPGLRLVLGHGSGSFGHVAARKHHTRQGVTGTAGWLGFAEVWREAAALNRIVMQHLHTAGLPAMAFPPSAGLISAAGKVTEWNVSPLWRALSAGLLPVVYGDVVFDEDIGGTIFSTEDLFAHLAREFRPQQIGLAGLEAGVWSDFPACTHMVEKITPANFPEILPALGGSAATDVTGGMLGKVREMLRLVDGLPGTEVYLFSGVQNGHVARFLSGDLPPGTLIAAD
jgi:isopentenyl phosphate kinase